MAQSSDFIVKHGLVVKTTATINSNINSVDTSSGALVVSGGVGIGNNLNVGGHIIGGGVRTSSTSTTPLNATVGDLWYNTNNDVTYRYTYDGVSNNWVDITGATANPFYGGHLAVSSISVTDGTVSISTESGALTVEGGVGIKGAIHAGAIYSNGILLGPTGPGTTSTQNIAGGAPGQIPYQENTNVTTFFGPGNAGQLLVSNGPSVPTYTNTGSIHIGLAQLAVTATFATTVGNTGSIHIRTAQYAVTATNLSNTASIHVAASQYAITSTYSRYLLDPGAITVGFSGVATTSTNLDGGELGQIPYQTDVGQTSFIGPGNAGDILLSAGSNAPVYTSTGSIHIGKAQYAITATNLANTATIHVRTAQFSVTASIAQSLLNTGTTYVGRATTASNIAGGTFGYIPFQASTGTTTFLPLGTNGLILVANSLLGPTWSTLDSVSAGLANTATNLSAGSAGQIPYQTTSGATAFFGPGVQGQLLVSSGTNAPVYTSTGSIHVGYAQSAVSAITANRLSNTASIHVAAAQYAVTATNLSNTASIHVGVAQYSITATNSIYAGITNNSVSSTPRNITFSSGNSGYSNIETDSGKLNYIPSQGQLTVPSLYVSATKASTGTTSSNALYVAGGAWVDSLYVNQGTIFTGPVVFNGTATYVYSTNTVYTDSIIELHVPPSGPGTPWTLDDGKNIGLRFHYYKSGQDKTSFLGQDNTTGLLEWFVSGAENPSGIFTGSAYGGIRAGTLILATATNSISSTTGALTVAGGVGISKDVYIGGDLTVLGTIVSNLNGTITTASNIAGGLAGQLLYQSDVGSTNFVGPGIKDQLLSSNGSSAPTYVNTADIYVGNAQYSQTSTYATTATTANYANTAGYAQSFNTSTLMALSVATLYATTASYATTSTFAQSFNTSTLVAESVNAGYAISADYATTATYLSNPDATRVGYSNSSTNLSGGDFGSLPYQSASGTTTFLPIGNSGYILKAGAGGVPVWGTIDTAIASYANTATNLAGGVTGQMFFQSTSGSTTFFGPGNAGQILISTGSFPTFTNTSSVYVGVADYAVSANIATSSTTSTYAGHAVVADSAYTSTYATFATTATYAEKSIKLVNTSSIQVAAAQFAVTATNSVYSTTATNFANGSSGSLVYQSSTGTTSFLPLSANGYILTAGLTSPQWSNISDILIGSASTTTNIAGGTTGQIPYQADIGSTAFFGPGSLGQLLMSSGAAAPSYASTASVHIGLAQLAITATNATRLLNTGTAQVGSAQFAVTASNATRLLNTGTVHVGAAQVAVTATFALYAGTATDLLSTATIQVAYAVSSTNFVGGETGSLPYQTSPGRTSFLPLGSNGYVLTAGALGPQWTGIGSLSAGVANTATNLADGTAGQIPYQYAPGLTLFVGPGAAGQLLVSTGASAPAYTDTSTIYVGYASNADTANIVSESVSATSHYVTFVSSDIGRTAVKTDSNKLTYQPNSGQLTASKLFLSNSNTGGTTSSNALYVAGGAYVNSLFVNGNTTFAGGVTFNGTATYVYSTNTYYTDNIVELHVPPSGPTGSWDVNDGKDVGIRFHYFNGADQNAALVLANETGYLEWYGSGAESNTGTFVGSSYGGIKTGTLLLNTGTNATTTNTGALVVQGGAGIWRDMCVGGNLNVTGTVNATVNGTITTATNIANGAIGSIPYQSLSGSTKFIGIGASGSMLVSNGTTATYSNTVSSLVVTTTLKHSGLVPTAGSSIDQIYTTSTSLTLSTTWQNIGVSGNALSAGTYLVQVLANDSSAGGGQVNTYYSGVMSWYNGGTSESSFDEIALHRAGSASSTGSIYLQVLRAVSGVLNLQMAGNTNNIVSSTYNFSFRRMI